MKSIKKIKVSILVVLAISIASLFRHGFDWLTIIALVLAAAAIVMEAVDIG